MHGLINWLTIAMRIVTMQPTIQVKSPISAPGAMPVQEVLEHFGSDRQSGLTSQKVLEHRQTFGLNAMTKRQGVSAFTLAVRQFQSTVVILLLVASAVSFVSKEHIQGWGILIAVLINALVGFATELKAKISLESLEAMAGPTARTVRDGKEIDLPASELVPGDVVILDSGDRVPADLRIIEASSLSADESAMTGESESVYKTEEPGPDNPPESTQLFQGTLVLSGRGRAIVYATGNNTKLGQLGILLTEAASGRTPLENGLEELGKQLTLLTVVLCTVIAGIGVWHKENIFLMLQTAVALAVAAIPEGMPVVATLALTAGTHRMVRARALIRQLAAVETLGCTTVICTDKTGTLTENQMVVTDLIFGRHHYKVSGQGYAPEGEFTHFEDNSPVATDALNELRLLLRAAALCNDARLEKHEQAADQEGVWHIHGDPTEGALLTAAAKAGLTEEADFCPWPRVQDLPFDLERKRMSTIHDAPDSKRYAFIKGSPGTVLQVSKFIELDALGGIPTELTEEMKQELLAQNSKLAARGLRVLAVGYKTLAQGEEITVENIESEITLLGLVGMSDRPRQEVPAAIEKCHKAGIKVLMLTGDQPATAKAIAEELKLLSDMQNIDESKCILRSTDLEAMSETELGQVLKEARVLARATPQMKLKVVKSLQANGEIVAMTGDGVNDAPALRQANIGIAMGQTGTALAREASSMVITDDNFATIVKAVEEGRIIYGNIQKAIAYLLTASLSAVVCVALAVVLDTGLPFTPLQLLWLNLIMHIFPGLAIVMSRTRVDVMSLSPRRQDDKLINNSVALEIALRSLVVATAVLLCLHQLRTSENLQTLAFASLSLALILQSISWMLKASKLGPTKGNNATEPRLKLLWPVVNVLTSLALLVLAVYCQPIQELLAMHALNGQEAMAVLITGLGSFIAADLLLALKALCGKRQ